MTIRFLLDTNTLSEPNRPSPDPRLLARLQEHRLEMATAAPVWSELLYGMERLPRSRKRSNLQDYLFRMVLPSTPILPYDWRAAEWCASERARLSKMGRSIPFIDGQIAAVAAVHGLVLVTSNRIDFAPFEGLEIQDWKGAR